MQETQVQSLGQGDPLERETVTHSSILAWRIPWTEKPGRLQSTGSQRVGHDFTFTYLLIWYICFWFVFVAVQFSSVQSIRCVWLFAIPGTAARQASLSITNTWSILKFMSIESVIPSRDHILCCPLLLPPSIFPRIRVFSNWVSFSHQVVKVLDFQLQPQSFQWIFSTDFL